MSDQSQSLSARAVAAMRPNPPNGNTGGISRHGIVPNGENAWTAKPEPSKLPADVPQNTPPRKRASRARKTSPAMQDFLGLWFLDWLTLTIPNPKTGKGSRPQGDDGEAIQREAELRLMMWARTQGLWSLRVGNGSDGFKGAALLGWKPTDKERVASVRSGHATNMPSLEITGGDGACDDLAESARRLLGPVLVARADVTLDMSQPDLWDDLLAYAKDQSGTGAGKGMKAPRVMAGECGRTFYWGGDGVSVRVYEKDLERVARGKLDRADADEDLVRVEFTFRPESRRKAAFADLTPGEMLGTSRWARRMVETLGQMVGYTARGDTMGETKVREMPDATTTEQRAQRVIRQAAKTTIAAAAAGIVIRDFGGDWNAAEFDAETLHAAAVSLISDELRDLGTAADFIETNGLERVQDDDERAAHMARALRVYLSEQASETERAKAGLEAAMRHAGVGSSSSNVVPFGGSGIDGSASGDLDRMNPRKADRSDSGRVA